MGTVISSERPRPVRPTATTTTLQWFILITYCLVTITCWRFMSIQLSRLEALHLHSRSIQAHVVTVNAGDDGSGPSLDYAFTVWDREYTGTTQISSRMFQTVRERDPISVSYLPEDPYQNTPGVVDSEIVGSARNTWQIGLAVITAIGALFYWILMSSYAFQSRLLREGLAVEATVTSSRKETRDGATTSQITFRYTDETGKQRTGYTDVPSSAPHAQIGSIVTYVYLPGEAPFGKLFQSIRLAQIAEPDG